ncbi:MAG: hypothetical protein V3R51_03160 [Gammaproteobacteria bacterium]
MDIQGSVPDSEKIPKVLDTMIDSVLCDGFSPPQDLPSAGCASCSSCCHLAINFGKGATFGLASTKLVWSHRHMQIIPLLFKLAR